MAANRSETAAQTAQAVADSLPEDYVTAVGKIAENTAEISAVKLTDKELQRRVNALYDMGNGITHQFETDSETAYQKAVPTGAKLMSVKNIGGRSIVWNQLCDTVLDNFSSIVSAAYHEYGICKFTANVGDKICIYSGGINGTYVSNGAYVAGFIGSAYIEFFGKQIVQCTENGNCIIYLRLRGYGNPYSNVSVRPEFFNLTKMFGSGNEPSTVEEFEKMFPADYYPYNAGEIVSAGVTEVSVCDTAHPIPEAIRNLPGYGVEGNVVDYEAKIYTQNNAVDGMEIKALETPIVTDISSLIPDDFLRNIEVEAGGSVTFRGGNDDYRIPVPSEEEYVVKLSEVGGTT